MTHPECTEGPLCEMNALRRYVAGTAAEPPKVDKAGSSLPVIEAAGAGGAATSASSSPESSECEKSHSTAASASPPCSV